MVLPETLRSLRHRNYLLYISGQIVSLVGDWVQATAQQWLVYSLTMNALYLGFVGFAAQAPVLALGLFAGVVADSVNRHRLIVITQILLMGQAFALALLTLLHGPDGKPLITLWHIIMLATFTGTVQAFNLPARLSFMAEVVSKEDLGNAIALNSLSFNAARIVGPAIAGTLIAVFHRLRPGTLYFGEGACFLINAVSFLAVIIQLLRMNLAPGTVERKHTSSESYLVQGLKYVSRRPHIRAFLYHVAMMSMFGVPYLTVMPVFAKDIFQGDAQSYSSLLTSIGVGALIGGVMMARRTRITGLGRVIVAATAGFSVVALVFSWLNSLALACVVVGLGGFCMVSAMIGSQTLIQTLVSENYRGRVMGLYNMMSVGLMPFGSLIIGANTQHFGPRWSLTANAVICLATALVLMTQLPALRRAAHAAPEYRALNPQA